MNKILVVVHGGYDSFVPDFAIEHKLYFQLTHLGSVREKQAHAVTRSIARYAQRWHTHHAWDERFLELFK